LVYNKIDLCPGLDVRVDTSGAEPGAVWVSARSGDGIGALSTVLQDLVFRDTRRECVHVPPQAARVRAFLYDHSVVRREELDSRGGWLMEIDIEAAQWGRVARLAEFGLCSMPDTAAASAVAG
jgi:GTP-binding protein HflX